VEEGDEADRWCRGVSRTGDNSRECGMRLNGADRWDLLVSRKSDAARDAGWSMGRAGLLRRCLAGPSGKRGRGPDAGEGAGPCWRGGKRAAGAERAGLVRRRWAAGLDFFSCFFSFSFSKQTQTNLNSNEF
jgi:hypothetical protein